MKNGKKLQEHLNKDLREDVNRLYSHADVANKEMGQVKEHLSSIKTDLEWIKKSIEKVDTRSWLILATIVTGFVIQIYLRK